MEGCGLLFGDSGFLVCDLLVGVPDLEGLGVLFFESFGVCLFWLQVSAIVAKVRFLSHLKLDCLSQTQV